MRLNPLPMLVAIVLAGCISPVTEPKDETSAAESPALLTWGDLLARELPTPTSTHAYGENAAQVVDLWLPEGKGPHPVVLMVHGGCWQKAIADRTLMNYAAEDLRERGLAVWNIEYRGVDEAGGGYPGTFMDVAEASEMLFEMGPQLGLDTDRVAAIGHSAGGHLVAWLATRHGIEPESPLAGGDPLPLAAAIVSGGLADLKASEPVTLTTCLADIRDDLVGTSDGIRADVYADTSPVRLLPTNTPFTSVNGERDRIAPPALGVGFTNSVRAAGGKADYVEVSGAGHVELVAPGTEAFDVQARLLLDAVGR